MRRALAVFLALSLAGPAPAQMSTGGLGLQIEQDGTVLPLTISDGTYSVTLRGARFDLLFPDPPPDIVGVIFGADTLFDMPEDMRFGPGTAYARYAEPLATHFLTDPLCATGDLGPGFNRLDDRHRTGGRYPVAAIEVDSQSRGCTAPGRLPPETDLLGRVDAIYVVVRTGGVEERLILQFVRS